MKANKVPQENTEPEPSEAGTVKVSVYLPRKVHRRFLSELGKSGRKQAPVLAAWVEEYLREERDLPEAQPPNIAGNPSPAELRFLAEVLALVRSNPTAHSVLHHLVKEHKKLK